MQPHRSLVLEAGPAAMCHTTVLDRSLSLLRFPLSLPVSLPHPFTRLYPQERGRAEGVEVKTAREMKSEER